MLAEQKASRKRRRKASETLIQHPEIRDFACGCLTRWYRWYLVGVRLRRWNGQWTLSDYSHHGSDVRGYTVTARVNLVLIRWMCCGIYEAQKWLSFAGSRRTSCKNHATWTATIVMNAKTFLCRVPRLTSKTPNILLTAQWQDKEQVKV